MLEYQNIKIYLQKPVFQILSEEVFVITKVQNTVPWTYVISDLKSEEIVGIFCEKELQKTNRKEFIFEKIIRRKGGKLYVKWKGYDNSINSAIKNKWYCYIKICYLPIYSYSKNKMEVELDLSKSKSALKIGEDTSQFAKEAWFS